MRNRIWMPGAPPGNAAHMARDERFAQRLFPLLWNVAAQFIKDNPEAAHGALVAVTSLAVRYGHVCGMRAGDWEEFARQVWTFEEKGGFGRGS